jgi:hypothetical protein
MQTTGRTAWIILPTSVCIHVFVPEAALEGHKWHEMLMLLLADSTATTAAFNILKIWRRFLMCFS